MNKQLILEKYIKVAVKKALKEQEEQQRTAEKAVYLTYRFPGLRKLMEDLMSPAFNRYITDIKVVAPKPTTFKVELKKNQDFGITYLGKGKFNVKVSGKKYNPINLGELERASQSIANILELNYASGEEKLPADTSGEELAADINKAETPPVEETPPTEETPPA